MSAFPPRLESYRARTEQVLQRCLSQAAPGTERLGEAMRYSTLAGGKRLRPILVYLTGESLGAELNVLDSPAAAVELIHAYSLVHDDLPAMDDDDLRRGRPTCHRAFDEATAILVGDALQALAFAVLADDAGGQIEPALRLEMIRTLARVTGTSGMAGGPVRDSDRYLRDGRPRETGPAPGIRKRPSSGVHRRTVSHRRRGIGSRSGNSAGGAFRRRTNAWRDTGESANRAKFAPSSCRAEYSGRAGFVDCYQIGQGERGPV